MNKEDLIAFEKRVAEAFESGEVSGPVHLSGGNEEILIDIFKNIHREDWVFSTYRSHYHALLHGLDPNYVYTQILAGRSMNITDTNPRFFSSAIVGGCLPIAVGVALGLKKRMSKRMVWCFIGDMAATTGAFHEAHKFAVGHDLPIKFVIEDNGLSCDSPTKDVWGENEAFKILPYLYKRSHPHVGTGKFVQF